MSYIVLSSIVVLNTISAQYCIYFLDSFSANIELSYMELNIVVLCSYVV